MATIVSSKCVCLKCGYIWTPRVAKPKSCPECKTRLSKVVHSKKEGGRR